MGVQEAIYCVTNGSSDAVGEVVVYLEAPHLVMHELYNTSAINVIRTEQSQSQTQ